jgi:tetratricopeptide (TPR) repeat protein
LKVTVPEELFRAKKSRVLLPFFGAGVSAALGVPSWRGLLTEISEKINCPDALREKINALDWNTNFEELSIVASELMKASGNIQVFMNFLQEALRPEISSELPERFKAVSELRDDLPGIVTTNFDTVLENYCNFTPDEVVYRNYEDLLKRLQQRKFLFKIHGDPTKPNLMIFTKEQYETLENDIAYQEVFKQIFLQWSIIFVGYSITDTYVLKNLEYLHRNHVDELEVFALLPDAELELQKRLRRIGVRVIPYRTGSGTSAHSAVDAFLAILDSNDFIPAPESGFQGRLEEINAITRALIESKSVFIELVGPAGIGKTQLARAAAQNIRQEEGTSSTFDTSIFVDLINKRGSNSLIYGIRDALGVSEAITEEEEIFNEVASRRSLIIADNVEDPLTQEQAVRTEFIDSLVHLCAKLKGRGTLIITSRTALDDEIVSRIGDIGNAKRIDLGPLYNEEARDLFVLESKAQFISEIGEEVLKRLSANPGSIRILGRRVAKLSDEGKETLFKSLLESPEKASKAVLTTTFELLPEDTRLALQVALAFPAGLSPEVARFEMGEKFTELLAPALQNGLLLRSGGRYRSIESIRQLLSSEEITQRTMLNAINFYRHQIASFQNELKKGVMKPFNAPFLLEEFGNISACANVAEKFDHVKLEELTSSICIFFQWSGFLEDPTRWIRTVYASEAISSHDIGILLLFANNLFSFGGPENNRLAERIYRRILDHYEKLTDLSSTSRSRVIQSSEALALLLMNVGGKTNLVEAENLFRTVLDMKKKYFADSNEEQAEIAKTADALANLISNFQGETNLREAEKLIRESFTINKRLAEVDPRAKFNLAQSMLSLSRLLQRYGETERMPEIEELTRKALSIHREMATLIPGARRALVQSLTLYADALRLQKQRDKRKEIEQMYREAIEIQREMAKTQPSMRTGLASTLYSLAIHLRMGGEQQFDEAQALQREALSIFEDISETMPSALEGLAYSLIQLASFIKDFGDKDKLSEAESFLRQAATIIDKVEEIGISTSRLKVQCTLGLAQLLRLIGGADNLEEAEHLYRQVIDVMKEDAQYLPRAMLSMASIYIALAELISTRGGENNITEAMTLYKESIKIQEDMIEQVPELQINLALVKANYANFLHNFGLESLDNEILLLYQDALKTTKALVTTNPQFRGPLAHILLFYAQFLGSKGRLQTYKQAESLLRESLEIKRDLAREFKAEQLGISDTLTTLGAVLQFMGGTSNLEEAEKCYRDALSIKRELIASTHLTTIDISPATTDLAHILIHLGGVQRIAEAENLLRETMKINKEQVERNPLVEMSLARTSIILADLLRGINDPKKIKEAELLYTSALGIFRKWIKDVPARKGDLALTLLNLSSLLFRSGDPSRVEEIEAHLREAVSICKENIGTILNAEMSMYKAEIALVDLYLRLASKEKLFEAETLCREALNHLKKSGTTESIEIPVMDASYKLVNILWNLGGKQKYSEAELILREALAYAKTHPMDEPSFQSFLARIEFGLAFTLTNIRIKESLNEAEDHFRGALNIQRKLARDFPEVKLDLLKTLYQLAELSIQFRNKDKFVQAEILYREVLSMLKANRNLSTNPDSEILNIMVKLADVLQAIGNTEQLNEIEDLLKESLGIARKMAEHVPSTRIYVAQTQYKLAKALESLVKLGKKEKLDEIETSMDEAIAIYAEGTERMPGLLGTLGEYLFFLAACLHMYGLPQKFDQAKARYKDALNVFDKLEQTPDVKATIAKTLVQLAQLQEKMSHVDDAEQSYRESLKVARTSAVLKPEYNEFVGKLAYNFALLLKKHKASSAKEEITSLLQEAKTKFRELRKDDLVKRVEETEKSDSQ